MRMTKHKKFLLLSPVFVCSHFFFFSSSPLVQAFCLFFLQALLSVDAVAASTSLFSFFSAISATNNLTPCFLSTHYLPIKSYIFMYILLNINTIRQYHFIKASNRQKVQPSQTKPRFDLKASLIASLPTKCFFWIFLLGSKRSTFFSIYDPSVIYLGILLTTSAYAPIYSKFEIKTVFTNGNHARENKIPQSNNEQIKEIEWNGRVILLYAFQLTSLFSIPISWFSVV